MKIETQIAEENIKKLGEDPSGITQHFIYKCEEHKATCQRFLEFLVHAEKVFEWDKLPSKNFIRDKITDLKQAIKLYDEAGI